MADALSWQDGRTASAAVLGPARIPVYAGFLAHSVVERSLLPQLYHSAAFLVPHDADQQATSSLPGIHMLARCLTTQRPATLFDVTRIRPMTRWPRPAGLVEGSASRKLSVTADQDELCPHTDASSLRTSLFLTGSIRRARRSHGRHAEAVPPAGGALRMGEVRRLLGSSMEPRRASDGRAA